VASPHVNGGVSVLDNPFKWLFLIGLIVTWVLRLSTLRRTRQDIIAGEPRTQAELLTVYLNFIGMPIIPFVYLFTSWLDFADYWLPAWAGWIGVVIFVAAILLLWRSQKDLGRNWSALLQIREDQTLVTDGVFRYIRHPNYAANWLWGFAQALLLWNWIAGLSKLVCFLPFYLQRVRREEQMMLDRFGDEYRAYMTRTGRIIPRVWK
jgi:protein-S-isoprenylcysteine O-methyltransferase Ste14